MWGGGDGIRQSSGGFRKGPAGQREDELGDARELCNPIPLRLSLASRKDYFWGTDRSTGSCDASVPGSHT